MKKFLEYIPTVPDVPAAAVAVQPAVPFVSEQVQQQ